MFSFFNPIVKAVIAPVAQVFTAPMAIANTLAPVAQVFTAPLPIVNTPQIPKPPERSINNAWSLEVDTSAQVQQVQAQMIRQVAEAQANAEKQLQKQAIANAKTLANARFEQEANKAKADADKKAIADEKAKSDFSSYSSSLLGTNFIGSPDINSGGGGGGGGVPLRDYLIPNATLQPEQEPISYLMIAAGVGVVMIGGYFVMTNKKTRRRR
jgi:ABC-type multidrug transport system fused ATPase/permease subunit